MKFANSSIDVSDGLIDDLAKMINRQSLSFHLFENKIPVSNKLSNLIKKQRLNLHWLKMYFKCWHIKWDIVIDLRSSILSYLLFTKKKYIFKKNKKLSHINQLNHLFNIKNSELFVHTNNNEKRIVEKNLDKNFKYVVIFPGGNWIPKIWPANQYNELLNMLCYKFTNFSYNT